MDPSALTFLASALEKVVNSALRYDPASKAQIAAIDNVLAIQSTKPAITLYCVGSEEGIRIMNHCELPITTTLTGSPLSLLNLLKQPTSLANSGVELSGSVGLLQQWQDIMQQLDIDYEDAISSVVGDIAGPMLSNALRNGATWVDNQKTESARLLKEYLIEEIKLIPSKAEADDFYTEVNELSLDTDRAEARLNQILQKLDSQKEQ